MNAGTELYDRAESRLIYIHYARISAPVTKWASIIAPVALITKSIFKFRRSMIIGFCLASRARDTTDNYTNHFHCPLNWSIHLNRVQRPREKLIVRRGGDKKHASFLIKLSSPIVWISCECDLAEQQDNDRSVGFVLRKFSLAKGRINFATSRGFDHHVWEFVIISNFDTFAKWKDRNNWRKKRGKLYVDK